MGWRMTNCRLLSHWRISRATVKSAERLNDVRRFLKREEEMLSGVWTWRVVSGNVHSGEHWHLTFNLLCAEQHKRTKTMKLKWFVRNYRFLEENERYMTHWYVLLCISQWLLLFYSKTKEVSYSTFSIKLIMQINSFRHYFDWSLTFSILFCALFKDDDDNPWCLSLHWLCYLVKAQLWSFTIKICHLTRRACFAD